MLAALFEHCFSPTDFKSIDARERETAGKKQRSLLIKDFSVTTTDHSNQYLYRFGKSPHTLADQLGRNLPVICWQP